MSKENGQNYKLSGTRPVPPHPSILNRLEQERGNEDLLKFVARILQGGKKMERFRREY